MKANEIRAALMLAGVKVIDIASQLGIKQPSVSQAIYGTSKSPRVRKAIAEAIHRPVDEIWPPEKQRAA